MVCDCNLFIRNWGFTILKRKFKCSNPRCNYTSDDQIKDYCPYDGFRMQVTKTGETK